MSRKQKICFSMLAILALSFGILFCLVHFPGWKAPDGLSICSQWRIVSQLRRIQNSGICPDDTDSVESKLIELGFPTVDSDPLYPSCLANSDALYSFWQRACAGEDAQLSVLRVTEDCRLHHMFFLQQKNDRIFVLTEASLDEDGKLTDISTSLMPIYDMELADWDIFYYRLSPSDPHYIDNNQLRLKPADRALYDLNRKYILPVGYEMINLFLVDWQEGIWGDLSFNALLEPLYLLKNGKALDWSVWLRPGVSPYAYIPSAVFEDTICSFFSISRTELQTLCNYDPESDTYPYRPINGNDLTTWEYPMCEPEVLSCTENPDGTLKLEISIYSPERKPNCLFRHELTVRPGSSGHFQYVSNHISAIGEWGLPPAMPRFSLDAK